MQSRTVVTRKDDRLSQRKVAKLGGQNFEILKRTHFDLGDFFGDIVIQRSKFNTFAPLGHLEIDR